MRSPAGKGERTAAWTPRAIVLLLLLVGAALRLGSLGDAPPGLYHDEAQHGLDALDVLRGDVRLYFPANNGREPLFIYLVTAGVALLGRSPLAVRLPSFFAGILTLAATYDLARILWGRRTGRWALAVLAVTLWHVHLSRVGFRAVLLPLFTALFLGQLARAVAGDRDRSWVFAGLIYGASWYTYMAARFTPVALGVVVIYGVSTHFREVRKMWRGALLFCGAALIVLLPLGLYTLRHPDVVLTRTGQVSIFSPEINQGDLVGTVARHFWRTVGMFFVRGDRIWRHNLAWRPVWDPALGLAFVVGLGVALKRSRRDPGAALALLWTTTMTIPTFLAEDAPHFLRGVGVLPTAALLPAVGLAWLERKLGRLVSVEPKFARRLLGSVPLVLWLVGLTLTANDYFVRFAADPLAYHWFEGGAVALAGEMNAFLDRGWDGQRMLRGSDSGRVVYVDPSLWSSWSAVPFLVPPEQVRFLPVSGEGVDAHGGVAFFVWPYREWEPDVLPYLPHPAYLSFRAGPKAQGDKDPEPFTAALRTAAEPRPPVPAPLARFERGIALQAALVAPTEDGARVRLWWDAVAAPGGPYTVFVHYLRDGERIAQDDAQPGRGHLPTTLWQPGDLILDEHPLPGIDPLLGRDRLRIGLYHSDTGEGLSILDAAGNPTGGWVELTVSIEE